MYIQYVVIKNIHYKFEEEKNNRIAAIFFY